MKFYKKKWPWVSLALLLCTAIGGCFYLQYLFRQMVLSKGIWPTQATVIRKEHFRCDDSPCSYTSDYGTHVEMKRGDTQDRVYYSIDNFDTLPEPRRSRATQVEKERVEKFGVRFSYADSWYDKVGPGTKLYIGFRCFNDGNIEVWSIRNEP